MAEEGRFLAPNVAPPSQGTGQEVGTPVLAANTPLMKPFPLAAASLLLAALVPVAAQRPLDGSTAPRWAPCLGWVTNPPATYSVGQEDGNLVFTVQGKGTELPWLIALADGETTGDARYLLLRYRAEGLLTTPGNYFLHGQEGTYGGRTYAAAEEVLSDGQWHVLAVDLAAVEPAEPTHGLAVKVRAGQDGRARLLISGIWFADELPAGATVARAARPEARAVTFRWESVAPLKPAPGWITNPARDFSAAVTADGVAQFTVGGAGKAMRWPLTLPQRVDLAQLPYIALRYRAWGQLGPTAYALWLGDDATGAGGHSHVPLFAWELKADGEWHALTKRLSQTFTATQLAVGLDCDGEDAHMELDSITFSSRPPTFPLDKLLPHEVRPEPWPAGKEGMTTLAAPMTGGRGPGFLMQRLDAQGWFAGTSITVASLPFSVPPGVALLRQTGTAELGDLRMALPAGVREVFLLTAAAVPPTEPFGLDPAYPRPVEVLDQPEKVVFEIRYEAGPPDFVLPLRRAPGPWGPGLTCRGVWGMKRGLGMHVVHPDPARRATELILHDRMQTASFAVLAATLSTNPPRVAEPAWSGPWYPEPPGGALAKLGPASEYAPEVLRVISGKLSASFVGQPVPGWEALTAGDSRDALACAPGPVFEVSVGGKIIPPEAWTLSSEGVPDGRIVPVLKNSETGLTVHADCVAGAVNELRMNLRLVNESKTPVTATLRFPVLRGIRLGDVAETWYLCGKRGGIINRLPLRVREPLGERHPLQVDGFFNPRSGLALACLTHDTQARHHFANLAMSAEGGEWAPEYPDRDLLPGGELRATEAALVLCQGDWRAIFEAYKAWLATWYRPPTPKPWWERTFAFMGCTAHYDSTPEARQRGAIQPLIDQSLKYLGACDYIHLYGWSASKQYGEWGDYDHYEETVGGLQYFRDNIRRAQEAGIGVGLYQDGYLSCEKGQTAGAHAKEWAMQNPDGSPQYVKEYDAYNECPSLEGWQKHLAGVYARLHRDLGTKGLYIDEFGATDGRWACHARDHGHNSYEVPYAGEVAALKRIREAVGPQVALYTEYPGADVMRQITDGSFTYQALWSVDEETRAPHFIDLPRFAFPAFKQFHIIHYVTPRAGNWWPFKFPFFNGESYNIGEPGLPYFDAASLAFQRRAVAVLRAHCDGFTSHHVEPLVRTEAPGVFANAFYGEHETVWTLYNANGRSVHGTVLRVKAVAAASYEDAWAGLALQPQSDGATVALSVDLGPKSVGCLGQKR